MKETFEAYFPELLKHEGGYVDHPSDPGGATKYGITIGTLRDWRATPVTKLDVRNLTKAEAKSIYRARYWDAIDGDKLQPGVDAVAFDIAVNHGVGRWKQWKPIISGLAPVDAVRALCERRRRFYRSLKTFPTFGKGWMRRAGEVESWALLWAETHSTEKLSEAKPKTMTTSTEGGAAIVTGAAGAVVVVKEGVEAAKQAQEVAGDTFALLASVGPWVALGVVIVAAAGFIWWHRRQRLLEHGV